MTKSPRVPLELLASSQMQRHTGQEASVPLYLYAFDPALLGDPAQEDDLTAEADFGATAGGFSLCDDEDDDFY
ncbi:MAG: hypothetical protein Q8M47_11055 [Devosia sp.]|nr:hypothetical protein [Devosia sp.]